MKLIEFAINTNENTFSPSILLIDCNDISSFSQIPNRNDICFLHTKQNQSYRVYGTFKTLTNRFFYTLSKKNNIYEDEVIRPSIRVFHRIQSLEPDVAFMDPLQLKAFIFGIDPNFQIKKLPIFTQEALSNLN